MLNEFLIFYKTQPFHRPRLSPPRRYEISHDPGDRESSGGTRTPQNSPGFATMDYSETCRLDCKWYARSSEWEFISAENHCGGQECANAPSGMDDSASAIVLSSMTSDASLGPPRL